MCAYVVTGLLSKSFGAVCSLCRFQSRLPCRWLSSPTVSHDMQGQFSHLITQRMDRCLGRAGQLQPQIYSGMSRNQMPVVEISRRHVALSQTFASHARLYSALNARFGCLSQENCHSSFAAVSVSEGMTSVKQSDIGLWHRLKHALYTCTPVISTRTDGLLTCPSTVPQQCTASRSFRNSTCFFSQKPDKDSSHKPTTTYLHNVQELMKLQIPDIFNTAKHEYRIYTKDLVFENNWNIAQPQKIVGLTRYAIAILKARFHIHGNYAKVKVTVLNSSIDESLGCVHFRWRIAILSQRLVTKFWIFKPFKIKKTAAEKSDVLEGKSTFYLNSQGFIYRHVLDRVITDDGELRDV